MKEQNASTTVRVRLVCMAAMPHGNVPWDMPESTSPRLYEYTFRAIAKRDDLFTVGEEHTIDVVVDRR